MDDDRIVLVQLSDTHLASDRHEQLAGVSTFDSLKSVLDRALDQCPHAHAYIVTGDLSHDGSRQSYRNMKELLNGRGKPVYVIPGNHDDVENMRADLLTQRIRFPDHVDIGDWRLIFLNSHVPGEEYGYLDEQELGKLEDGMERGLGNYLVCVHHPPIRLQSPWIDRSRLANPDDLFRVLGRAEGHVAVLCGHAHQEYISIREGIALMGTPSTCTQFRPGATEFELDDSGPGFRVVELHGPGDIDSRVIRLGGPGSDQP